MVTEKLHRKVLRNLSYQTGQVLERENNMKKYWEQFLFDACIKWEPPYAIIGIDYPDPGSSKIFK